MVSNLHLYTMLNSFPSSGAYPMTDDDATLRRVIEWLWMVSQYRPQIMTLTAALATHSNLTCPANPILLHKARRTRRGLNARS